MISELDLHSIVGQASSLWERLAGDYEPAPGAQPQRAAARLERWKKTLAEDNEQFFCNRLRWSGLNEAELLPFLDKVVLKDSASLPTWSQTLKAVSSAALDLSQQPEDEMTRLLSTTTDPQQPIPFEDFFAAHLVVARREMARRFQRMGIATDSAIHPSLITTDAISKLERGLLHRLSNASLPTLFAEFQKFKSAHGAGEMQGGSEHSERAKYQAFRDGLIGKALIGLYTSYPVLGRLHALTIESWIAATAELIWRLHRDLPMLERSFGTPQDRQGSAEPVALGPVVDIQADLSELSCGGRSVAALEFRSGRKLIYKPKSVSAEQAFSSFLQWLNENEAPVVFRPMGVLDRGAYGWLEYVDRKPVKDFEEANRFYYRAGALTALLHLLQATDCHRNNLVADGEHLQLIDAETLCQPNVHSFDQTVSAKDESASPEAVIAKSVIRTSLPAGLLLLEDSLLLTAARPKSPGRPTKGQRLPAQRLQQDTLAMQPSASEFPMRLRSNVPTISNQSRSACNYVGAIRKGFRRMYRYLKDARHALLGERSPLDAFAGISVRFLLRRGAIYMAVLNRSLLPENLQNGIDRSISVDLLARAYAVAQKKPDAWPLVQEEINAVECMDIPIHRALTTSTDLHLGSNSHVISGYFTRPSYEEVRSRIEGLDEEDLEIQSLILESTFRAKAICETLRDRMPEVKHCTRHAVGKSRFRQPGELTQVATNPRSPTQPGTHYSEGKQARSVPSVLSRSAVCYDDQT